jgi:predicted ATPase
VAQVLPVVMLSLIADKDDLVMIEQPELHLHPSGQAELGDLFVEVIYNAPEKRRADGKDGVPEFRKVRFLLETHSEHLLLRLRRRVAETSSGFNSFDSPHFLNLDAISAFFVVRSQQQGNSFVAHIELGSLGEFKKMPKAFAGFFSNDLHETAQLTRARLRSEELAEEKR